MTNHTPGPWTVEPTKQHEQSGAQVFKVINAAPYGGLIADVSAWWASTESAEANARLIAAAPELLEALEEILFWFQATEVEAAMNKMGYQAKHGTTVTKAKAAIALTTKGK